MDASQIFEQIKLKRSFLCIGLDSEIAKIPEFLLTKKDPIFEFNKAIVDATAEYAVAYKANLAFYEYRGAAGWDSLHRTISYIKKNHPNIFTIADAKRGDISNTSRMYAEAYFKVFGFDAVTLSPYIGHDTVAPFLVQQGKWAILLALTSNSSFDDFQMLKCSESGKFLFEEVISKSMHWGTENNMMYVVGATRADLLGEVRNLAPDHFLLVPGVGEQGGSLAEVARKGMNGRCGLLVNSARGIIYADRTMRFAGAAKTAAIKLQKEMEKLLSDSGLL
jgi:orotidine-5'-phosphate decarboxylase